MRSLVCSPLLLLLLSHHSRTASAVKCNHDGELLPNSGNCRKYFKCSNGAPSLQSCPGTLVFDPVLHICNWPDSSTCVAESKKPTVKILSDEEARELLQGIQHDDSPTAPTAKPRRKNISSLFHTKDRKKFTRISQRHRNRNRDQDRTATTTTTTSKPPSPFRNRGPSSPSFRDRGGESVSDSLEEKEEPERINLFRNRGSQTTNTRVREDVEERRPFRGSQFSSADREEEERRQFASSKGRGEEQRQPPFRGSQFSQSSDEESDPLRDQTGGRRPFRNRGGGGSFSSGDDEEALKEELFEELEETPVFVKPTPEPIKCHTGASNELYAHPRNCRKYYKCDAGSPSLQSCPANLIFDTNLRICNWPTASNCVEDPDAPLPEISSSDRHPAKPRNPSVNAINIDSAPAEYDTELDYSFEEEGDFFVTPKPSPVSPVAYPGQGSVPSEREALAREKQLKSEYPLFEKVKKTVATLDTKIVEAIEPRNKKNPDNVRRVEFILSEENYDDLFPRRHSSYTYRRLLQAIGKFPAICGYLGKEDHSDSVCRRTLATMFAHFTQETGAHNPSDKEFEEWRQGLHLVRELGCTDTSPGCGYNGNCEDKDSITRKWACGEDRAGKFKKYYGRGAKQLSYNFNYGQFSQAMFGEGSLLLDYPDFVADTWLNLASATWFYTTPQPPKPSMLHVIDGTWVPNSEDRRNGISPGFGATINIINGGLECNTKNGRESNQAKNRIAYYKQFAWYLYVDTDDEELGCANQKQFTAGGAGALPIYWDKDWAFPYSCKLVNYQTAHSALVSGEYIDCVEENFKVTIRNK